MPVDYTGAIIAVAVWIVGTIWAHSSIRNARLARHDESLDSPLPAVRPVFWTIWVSIGLAVFCFFIAIVVG